MYAKKWEYLEGNTMDLFINKRKNIIRKKAYLTRIIQTMSVFHQ